MQSNNLNDFFFDHTKKENQFFDESPKQTLASLSDVSGTMNTSQIDAFRQGVEITNIKHYDAGIVKIHAGEPGHRLKLNWYGIDRKYNFNEFFVDGGGVDPTQMVGMINNRSKVSMPFISVPNVNIDSSVVDSFIYNGVIDALGNLKRSIVTFGDCPMDVRGAKASIQEGNTDFNNGSSLIVSIYDTSETNSIPFTDAPELCDKRWPTGDRKIVASSLLEPFKDVKLFVNYFTGSAQNYSQDLVQSMSSMSGTTDNYVNAKQRSAVCGWDYNTDNPVGTDSIAFGEMSY